MSEIIKKTKGKILILGNSHLVVFGFRGEIIERLISEGYDVVVSFPNGPFGEGENTSKEYGCKFIETPINRRGAIPTEDFKLFLKYKRIIKDEKPDIVFAYTVKCDTYGGIACRMTKTPFIPNITGIGKAMDEGGRLEKIVVMLYKVALKNARIVFFQNTQDRDYFLTKGILFKRNSVLPGSGVNLQKFQVFEYPTSEPIVFTYVARVMKAKGIEQFLDAARALKGKAEFHICGYCEEAYKDILEEEQNSGTIIYHGYVNNIIDYERSSHCIVLPSFHPEGVSNVLLEAAALARPIITTNRAGCRETVDDGQTGLLVKERDSQDLIDKMEKFISMSTVERREMGLKGRKKIEREFDRKIIVDMYLREINSL